MKLSSLKIEKKEDNLPLHNQVVMIDTVDIGELNNIKLQGKKGSTEKKNVYNGSAEVLPKKQREQKVESNENNEIKSQNYDKKSFEKKEKKEVSDNPLNKEKLDTDKPSAKEQLAPRETEKIAHSKKNINNIEKDDYEDSGSSSKQELASILKSIEKSKEETKISNVKNNADGLIGKGKVDYDDNYNTTIKVLDSIRSKFIKCWTVPIGAKDVEELRVKIHVSLSTTGKVMNAIIYDTYSYNNNPFFRAMADSALRAVYMCSPLTSLPENLYDIWSEVELNFDSRDMI